MEKLLDTEAPVSNFNQNQIFKAVRAGKEN